MILELKVRNFLSFKEKVTFSFEATADKSFEDYYVTEVVPGVRILKMAMVYGANASGKSNLIEAFGFLSDFIDRKSEDKNDGIPFVPFMFGETVEEPGSFELVFYVKKTKYVYFLELDREKVIQERLLFYPGTQPAIIFDRNYNSENDESEFSFGAKIKKDKASVEAIRVKLLKNVSFFVAYNQVNFSNEIIDGVMHFFYHQFLDPITPEVKLAGYTTANIKKDAALKDFAVRFMKNAQYNISDIKIRTEHKEVPEEMHGVLRNSDMPESAREELISKGYEQNLLEFEHSILNDDAIETYDLPEAYQSEGTIRYYGFSAPLFRAFKNNAFLAIDELESKLHSHLVKHLVREFLMEGRKYPKVQLLFTTHDTSLLSEKEMLRKDAIWFTEQLENGSTDLYSMSDFDIRKELSYYNAYNHGKFGAIPNLD